MAKVDVLDVFRSKQYDPLEFHFESLQIPNMYCYLTQQDIDQLRYIATSPKYASKIDKKYEDIDTIMRNRGFKRFSAGTNRVVYRYLEDNRFLAKIAVDKVGMQDNPLEYQNQLMLKPFVTKMFQISPCGTVGLSERVLPIKNKAEFRAIASDVFDVLINKILGTYVVEDVGTKYFMNWGIRYGFGPVLLDYPYVYKLDGNKLYCTAIDQQTGCMCNGEIDYDVGFNKLVCTKCGKKYLATDLRDDTPYNKIIIKGGDEMRIRIKNNDKVVYESDGMDEFITKPKATKPNSKDLKVRVLCNGKPIDEPEVEVPCTVSDQSEPSEQITPVNFDVDEASSAILLEYVDESDTDGTSVIPGLNNQPVEYTDADTTTCNEDTSAVDNSVVVDSNSTTEKASNDETEIDATSSIEVANETDNAQPIIHEDTSDHHDTIPIVYTSKSDNFDSFVGSVAAAMNSGFIKKNSNNKKNKKHKGKDGRRSVIVTPTANAKLNKREDDE